MTRREYLQWLAALAAASAAAANVAEPPRKTRAQSYFGLHFDLHPNESDTDLGRDVSDEMVARLLDRVHPDFVQYDCKGHPGWMGYPSHVQKSAGMVRDSLAVWRRVTAARGVSLYIHFSGILDYLAAAEHPEWAEVHSDEKPDAGAMSTFSPYEERLMIPELLEAAEMHDLDGAWVDGDCWAVQPDYCAACAEEFPRKTGTSKLPKHPADTAWRDFLEINRASFRSYVRRYVDALHQKRPGFQIASNWFYSTFAPERPELPVDFLSGDYSGNAAISTARLQARYLAATGRPWDLMAWGFEQRDELGQIHKSAEQLQQEACTTLVQGGAFQIYYQPTRTGYIDARHVETMGRVADFVRRREVLCHGSTAVPQVGVIYSGHSIYGTARRVFGPWGEAEEGIRGMIDAFVENQLSVDVIPDWKLEDASNYPFLVVPEWPDLGDDATQALITAARGGASLLVVGAENARRFQSVLGVHLAGDPAVRPAYVPGREVFADLTGLWQDVEPGTTAVVVTRFPSFDSTRDGHPAATLCPLGKGKILSLYGPLGSAFARSHAPEVRYLAGELAARLFQPRFRVTAPPTIEVALRSQNGKTYLHLVNCTGMQVAGSYGPIDYIPPVGPIRIEGATAAQPLIEQTAIEPRANGAFLIPQLRLHDAIEIS